MDSIVYELPLVFVSGVLGSAHCIGMCGAISATMNLGTNSVAAALRRQLVWSIGRVFTYSFLGMLAGFAGARLTASQFMSSQLSMLNVQATLAVVAGVLLIIQGLFSAGIFRRKGKRAGGCLTASVFAKFLNCGSSLMVFVAGIATGFLPCGLVYSFLALAGATASLWKAPLLMAAFGLGTVPVMLLTGAGLSVASLRIRERLMKVAALCVVVTGVMTTGRGIAFAVNSDAESPQDRCPLCETGTAIDGEATHGK